MTSPIKLDLAPVENIPLIIDQAGAQVKIYFRPFSIVDEKWLADTLAGDDLFSFDSNEPQKLLAAILHQLVPSSVVILSKALALPLQDYIDNQDYLGAAEAVGERVLAHGIKPFVQVMVMLRAASIADFPIPPDKKTEKKSRHRKIWTQIFVWLCGFLGGFYFCQHYWHLLLDNFTR